nr:hypothetical protein [uncultured bacterium]
MATKNKKTAKATINKTVNTVKDVATKTNNFALKSTEEVVSEMIGVATKWQNLTSKAVKGGLKVAENQQNMVFVTLEIAKAQLLRGFKRSRTLFSKN